MSFISETMKYKYRKVDTHLFYNYKKVSFLFQTSRCLYMNSIYFICLFLDLLTSERYRDFVHVYTRLWYHEFFFYVNELFFFYLPKTMALWFYFVFVFCNFVQTSDTQPLSCFSSVILFHQISCIHILKLKSSL